MRVIKWVFSYRRFLLKRWIEWSFIKAVNEIPFDERIAFLLEQKNSKEEGNVDITSNEESVKTMIFEKDWDTFLEDFLLKVVLSIISLFGDDSFLNDKATVGDDEMIDSVL